MKDLINQLKSLPQDELNEVLIELGAFQSQSLTSDIESACDIDLSDYEEFGEGVDVFIFPQ